MKKAVELAGLIRWPKALNVLLTVALLLPLMLIDASASLTLIPSPTRNTNFSEPPELLAETVSVPVGSTCQLCPKLPSELTRKTVA